MGGLSELFESPSKRCEVCGREIETLGNGSGYVMLSPDEAANGFGGAEECRECGRVYCDRCYPSRPANTCVCGKGRDRVYNEGGVTFRGSLRLVKVRYLK